MHQGPGHRGQLCRVAAAVALDHPSQRAFRQDFHCGRGDPDQVARRVHRLFGGRRVQAVPAVRMRAGHACGGEPGQLFRRAAAAFRIALVVAHDLAQLAHQLGEHERTARRLHPRVEATVVGAVLFEVVEEPRRLLVLAGNRCHEQGPAGTAGGEVEQAPLLGQDRRGGGHRVIVHSGQQILQPFHAQHGSAQPQVRPGALLDPGDRDHRPLATRRGMRGEQRDAFLGDRRRSQRVARDLLRAKVIRECRHARAGKAVGVAASGVEQRDDRIEVPVRLRAK